MQHYMLYWTAGGVQGTDPIHWVSSAHARRLAIGDVVWAVTIPEPGQLHLVCRVRVAQLTDSRSTARRLIGHDDFWEADAYAIGRKSEARPPQRIDITALARRIRFDGDPDRLPPDVSALNLRSMRRLTTASVQRLEVAWGIAAEKPGRNPKWERDELILALDLYFRLHRVLPDRGHPEVVQLSALLNALPGRSSRPDAVRFRNPNGVVLKLANFRALERPGHGMQRGGRGDREVWKEFSQQPEVLRQAAEAIRNGQTQPEPIGLPSDPEDEAFPEGREALRRHLARERSRALVSKKKQQVYSQEGRLACEACGFDFHECYGAVGEGFIECHHAVPVSELKEGATTRLSDVVLLCANCHRMAHRKRPWLKVSQIRELRARK